MDISSNLITEFSERWDYKALSHNHTLNWNIDSFLSLKECYIDGEAIKSLKKRENTFVNNLPFSIEVRSKEDWSDFKKHRDFIDPNYNIPNSYLFDHSKNIFKNIKKRSGLKVLEFVSGIRSFPYEKYRIACLYGFIYLRKHGQEECLFVVPSFEPLYDLIKPWLIEKNEEEVLQLLKNLDYKKVQLVKKSIFNSLNFLRSDIKRSTRDTMWESYSKSYCPACHEDPCMCSDPF